jgi:hypothetical protein
MRSPAHDYVIKHGDTHNLASLVEAAGYRDVLGGWFSIATWVIVPNDNGNGSAADSIAKHLPRVNQSGCMISD